VPVVEGALLFRLAPEHFIVAIGVERRIDIDKINARIRQSSEVFEIISAVNDPRIDDC
jgi:hypothetical protein